MRIDYNNKNILPKEEIYIHDSTFEGFTYQEEEQKDKMKQTLLKYQEEESSLSYKDFIEAIFIEQGIVDEKVKEALLTALSKTTFDRFDKEQTVQFIDINKKFY